jgi:small-conductance mechanosensitive channel
VYTVWVVKKILAFKQILLCRLYKVSIDDMGRLELVDKIVNGVTVAIAALLLLDFLAIKTGKALSGVFAFGSIGTLTFTLASQGLVKELLSGVAINFSDKMYVGDNVKFGDGTSGKVIKLGWMETVLKGSDDIHQSVPNGEIQGQKMSNLSRLRLCQVAQTLRFDYDDVDKIPEILDSIRSEIKQSCPKVVTDGTSPFRVFLTNFNEDHMEVKVDTHYKIAPIGDAYWINRQNVLQAIMRAVKSHNVEFATLCTPPTFDSATEWKVIPKAKK